MRKKKKVEKHQIVHFIRFRFPFVSQNPTSGQPPRTFHTLQSTRFIPLITFDSLVQQ